MPADNEGDDAPEMTDDDKAERYRRVFEPQVKAWADGKGIVALLRSLEETYPHVFTLLAPEDDAAPRPWVPKDAEKKSVKMAHLRAVRHLHPDRMSQRDLSIKVEAEEVVKVLGAAYEDTPNWLRDKTGGTPSSSAPSSQRPGSAPANEAGYATSYMPGGAHGTSAAGGKNMRDDIFNFGGGPPAAPPPNMQNRTEAGYAANYSATAMAREDPTNPGGRGMREDIFGNFKAPQPVPVAQPSPAMPINAKQAAAAVADKKKKAGGGLFSFGSSKGKTKKEEAGPPQPSSKAKDNPFGGPASEPPPPGCGGASPFDAPPPSQVSGESLSAADALFGGSSGTNSRKPVSADELFGRPPAQPGGSGGLPDVSDLFAQPPSRVNTL